MAASTIVINGVEVSEPGSFTEIDTTQLETPALGANSVIAIIGQAIGGRPAASVAAANPLERARNSGQVQRLFRSGGLREMGSIVWNPGSDDNIPSGAAQVVFVKTNPAAASAASFSNTDGAALVLTSKDFGLFTTQIQIDIADATAGAPAKAVTVTFEENAETFDDLGVDAKFTLQYSPGADGGQRATATVSATAFEALFERDDAGLDGLVTTQATGGASIEVLSSNAGDTSQVVTVYGLDASGDPQTQVATLNGTTPVAVPGTWNLETAITLSAAAAGTVTLRNASGAVVIFDVPPATTSEGRTVLDIPVEDGASPGLTVEADGASTQQVVFRGIGQDLAPIAEAVTLNGTTPVAFSGLWSLVQSVELADVEAARTLTLKGRMINAPYASVPNLQQLKDKVNANSDFALVNVIGNPKDFLLANLDIVSTPADIRDPATASFFAILDDMITAINSASQIVTATRGSPGTGAPDNTGATVFLTGGHEGDATPGNEGVPTSTTQNVQDAVDLLKTVNVATLVFESTDAAVHAIGEAHCAFMAGLGKMERDMVVGAAANETLAALKTRALNLNSRHVRLCTQEVSLLDTLGSQVYQSPAYQAAIVAGMQAGSPIGEPMTGKFARVLGLRQNSGWNPVDDAEDLIQGGLVFMKEIDGRGRKIVRNVTTHLSSSNQVFIEASMNEAANFATRSLRENLESAVGRKGFSGTVNAAKAVAEGVLDLLLGDKIIVAHRNLTVRLVGDTLEVEVELAPVSPINFVKTVVHLVTVAIAA